MTLTKLPHVQIQADQPENLAKMGEDGMKEKEVTHQSQLVETIELRAPDGLARAPLSLVLTDDEDLLVLSFLPNRTSVIDRFDPSGKHKKVVARFQMGDRPGELLGPSGIAAGSDGMLFIPDAHRNRILALDSSGRLVRELGREGLGDGELRNPRDVEVHTDGRLLIADTNNHRIQVWTATGEVLAVFGAEQDEDDESPFLRHGMDPGEFHNPFGVTFDQQGQIWVADTNNHRIQCLAIGQGFVREFGRQGAEAGSLQFPIDVRLDAADQVLIADKGGRRIQWYAPDGKLLCAIQPLEALPPGAVVADVDVTDDGIVYIPVGPHSRVYKARAGEKC